MTAEQCAIIAPLIPQPPRQVDGRGRSWKGSREALNAMLRVLRSGARWEYLPERFDDKWFFQDYAIGDIIMPYNPPRRESERNLWILGAINGLGLGTLLEFVRQYLNLQGRASLHSASSDTLDIDTSDPLYWYTVPLISIIICFALTVLVGKLSSPKLKSNLLFWQIIGLSAISIVLALILVISGNAIRLLWHDPAPIIIVILIHIAYNIYFGIIVKLSRQL